MSHSNGIDVFLVRRRSNPCHQGGKEENNGGQWHESTPAEGCGMSE